MKVIQTATVNCPICDSPGTHIHKYDLELSQNTITMEFYRCPVCGKFELKSYDSNIGIDKNHLACYLAYNSFSATDSSEERYYTVLDKDICDELKANPENGKPVHIDSQIIENWYPRTFAERIDSILLYIGTHTQHIGDSIKLNPKLLQGIFFIDRWEFENKSSIPTIRLRTSEKLYEESGYITDYLTEKEYIKNYFLSDGTQTITLMPEGYYRFDSLQKNMSHGKNAFVAMQFGEKTKKLREAIRKGVSDAGYNAIFIDEVQHNNLITPEFLKYIRDSKFVVVDLTHQNNGAYFEEGYAMGIGKPVIQLCKESTQLHFDIAQKNTIMWNVEEDIPGRLTNRIKATID